MTANQGDLKNFPHKFGDVIQSLLNNLSDGEYHIKFFNDKYDENEILPATIFADKLNNHINITAFYFHGHIDGIEDRVLFAHADLVAGVYYENIHVDNDRVVNSTDFVEMINEYCEYITKNVNESNYTQTTTKLIPQ